MILAFVDHLKLCIQAGYFLFSVCHKKLKFVKRKTDFFIFPKNEELPLCELCALYTLLHRFEQVMPK